MELLVNRTEAGEELARRLTAYKGKDVVVYGLSRGGILTARVVADALDAPLDLLITGKVRLHDYPGQTVGAITDDGYSVFDNDACRSISFEWLTAETETKAEEAARRHRTYLGERAPLDVRGKTVILVDDGMDSGHTMEAALQSLRHRHPARIVIAVPVAPKPVMAQLALAVDEAIAILTPEPFIAVAHWYANFAPVEDRDVVHALREPVMR